MPSPSLARAAHAGVGSGMRPRSLPFVALILLAACRDVPQPVEGMPATLATHPRAMDRLARLMREQFAAADPVAVEQLIRCESARLEAALGDDFEKRRRVLTDSLREEYSSEQFNQ